MEKNFNGGVINLNKPANMTSHDAVNLLRKIFKTKQVGHTGTLDPMATGVLPVLIGNAVKASDFLKEGKKEYIAGIAFGIKTDTEDITGNILEKNSIRASREAFEESVLSFRGEYFQTPPMYSAVKVKGKKLYEYARAGIEIEREPRRVEIFDISLISFSGDFALIRVLCSKGTYIRTLICDICHKCGILGCMQSLVRTKNTSFEIESAVSLEELRESVDPSRFLVPTEELFSELPIIRLEDFYARLAENGAEIYLSRAKINMPPDLGQRVRLYNKDVFFALGELREFKQGPAIKPIKQF